MKPNLSLEQMHFARGITMVESLVALVVLSVGMLGIASLHVTSLKSGRTALVRTHAVNLVSDMADRIRANPRARAAYDTAAYGGAPTVRNCVVAANCSTQQLAEDDLARWMTQVGDALPAPTQTLVQFTPAAAAGWPDRYRVRVQWTEAGEPQPLSYEMNLSFIPVTP